MYLRNKQIYKKYLKKYFNKDGPNVVNFDHIFKIYWKTV